MAVLGLTGNGSKEARVAQKRAELEQARLNLSYTRICAPANGYITRKSVEAGNNIQPGQALMALVSLEDAWVTANYKESQLTNVKPGQKVEFTVDTYSGRSFQGKVESIMAGTGAAFSLLPPENATGNYVKVVQRIPVKIVIDKASDPQHLLRVGMSVEPTILTGRNLLETLKELNPF
jgi:membrane fusion protein (multidrug efflux system)